jgi:hypothetical protein
MNTDLRKKEKKNSNGRYTKWKGKENFNYRDSPPSTD